MKKKFIIPLLILCGVVIVFGFRTISGRDLNAKDKALHIRLNTTLNNSLSNIQELAGMDKEIRRYLTKWEMFGASLAIMRNDSLIYAKGYGWADKDANDTMNVGHIMRMASVSKLITAIGIMKLQDDGRLSIKDKVFGEMGVLKGTALDSLVKDTSYKHMTIEHLLRHQGGFYRDPLFSSRDVKLQMRLDHPPAADDFFRLVLSHNLSFTPGTNQKYSNIGYLLLSRIIEIVTKQPYDTYIKENVLEPAGCFDMHIGGNYYSDKRTNEVRYYTHRGDGQFIPEYNGSGRIVERSYGGNNIPLLSGAGAWCGSTAELARLVASIDGKDEIPDILSKEAIAQMTEYFDKDTYSLGWNETCPEKGWNRTGTLSGTTALIRYFPDGECWIFISNTSTWKSNMQAKETDSLFRKCRKLYGKQLPARNLFEYEILN